MNRSAPAPWYATLRDVVLLVKGHWRFVILCAMAGIGGGGAAALLLPSYYRSATAFQTESNNPSPITGALAGLASQLGNLPLGSQNTAQFFGDLVTTDAVLSRVAQATYPWKGPERTLADVYGFTDTAAAIRDYRTVRKLRAALSVDVNIRTGVVRFSVEARTPQLAQALAETTLVVLNQANIDLRRARAAAEREFTAGRALQAREELDSTEQALAVFYQRNRVIANSPGLQMEEARLKRSVDMAQQVYIQLRMQEEQAALQEVRNTPVVSVIDPPLVPVKRSWPNRRLAVALGLLVGLSLALARLLLLSTTDDQRLPDARS